MDTTDDSRSSTLSTGPSEAQLEKLTRNVDILSTELKLMQDATTTLESSLRLVFYRCIAETLTLKSQGN
jgi:hypothetical protein